MSVPLFQPENPERFAAAIRRFDDENACDPHQDDENGQPVPRELLYARRLTEWVLRLQPHASEALRLAARSQHLCRWLIPRSAYPMTRTGYLQWRAELKKFHAHKSAKILRELGYPEPLVNRVQELNLKKNFPADPEVRVLEDALCLVFLQFQFADLCARMPPEKLLNAVRKSWDKMTTHARKLALELVLPDAPRNLIAQAIGTGQGA
jgi:hypothetical protein